jgi:hypothetical protein
MKYPTDFRPLNHLIFHRHEANLTPAEKKRREKVGTRRLGWLSPDSDIFPCQTRVLDPDKVTEMLRVTS